MHTALHRQSCQQGHKNFIICFSPLIDRSNFRSIENDTKRRSESDALDALAVGKASRTANESRLIALISFPAINCGQILRQASRPKIKIDRMPNF